MNPSPFDDERIALTAIVALLPCLISVWALPLWVMPVLVLSTVAIAFRHESVG